MSYYEIDFAYKVEEYGTIDIEADDQETAEEFALESIKEAYPEALNVTIEEIKEIKR